MKNTSYKKGSASENNIYFGFITEESLRHFLKSSEHKHEYNYIDIEHLPQDELYYFWVDTFLSNASN